VGKRKKRKIMETVSCFVRKDFYIQPPAKDASPDVWAKWLKADARKAAAAKAAHTRSLAHSDAGDDLQETAMRKVGGVWKQCLSLGFVGDAESETLSAEPTVEAKQDNLISLARMELTRNKRGTKSKGKNARRKANKKKRK
jgi:hypothetical protein